MAKEKPEPPRAKAYNPLDKRNLGESVAEALLLEPVVPLPPPPFQGAGIYVIYYSGPFPQYQEVAKRNRAQKNEWPIYVGRAVPPGARKGGFRLDADPGLVLYKRLNEHAASIQLVQNLEIQDFSCRYLVVDDIWIPLAESLLIDMFSPLWNVVIEGFGIHDPGKGRRRQRRSHWDVLHPGRPWDKKQSQSNRSVSELNELVKTHVATVISRGLIS